MVQKYKKKWKDKTGSFSILFVIFILLFVITLIAFSDFLFRIYSMNEMQSIMDTSGVSALQAGVDEEELRLEKFVINENVVESTYRNLIDKQLPQVAKIVDYHADEIEVEKLNSSFFGLGETSKSRPQAVLKATYTIEVKNSPYFDLIPGGYKTFYDSLDNKNFNVNFVGTTGDGNIELVIRSVSRIVYQ